jgi:hypothetical protein
VDYGNSEIHKTAKKLQQCRDIVREIDNFGIDEMQRLQIIHLLSLGLEKREALEDIASMAKKHIGNPLEEAEKTQLEV